MSLETQAYVIIDLVMACLFSGIIGMDRERKLEESERSAAGLRTHILVGLGACLFTLVSRHGFSAADTSRVAAQVVSGIGFLGAGVIFVKREHVKNLTTAASIWTTAAVGMAVAVDAWLLAAAATVIIWGILVLLRRFEEKQFSHKS
ncbi:MAG: MgtC/SapB family protein [Aggregatilineales bacterium]